MDASLSSSRPRHQRKCVAILEIIQFPHKHSKSSDIRILEQFKYRCQEKKTLKENSNIKNGVSGDAQVGNYWNPSGRSWSLITMTSEGENSGKFKRLRHGGEILWLVGTGTKTFTLVWFQSNIQGEDWFEQKVFLRRWTLRELHRT